MYLGISVCILGLIISYDVTKCDGKVLMRPLIQALSGEEETDYDSYDGDYVISDTQPLKQQTPKTSMDQIKSGASPTQDVVVEEKEVDEIEEETPDFTAQKDPARGFEYYFNLLSEDERKVYNVMYEAFSNVESGNVMPTMDEDAMNKIAGYIRMDHPEFFYVESMGYTHYTKGGIVQKTALSAKYSDSKTAISIDRDNMDKVVDQIIATIPAGADDYTKVKTVYEWIVNNTDYVKGAKDNQNMKSVFLYHQSVCAGYAKALQYVLNKVGIPTIYVDGTSLISGEGHAWNICFVDGEYYYVDVTWGDASYTANGYSGGENSKSKINYDYLLVTTDEIQRTHAMSNDLILPPCNATANNYYIREGLYLTGYDRDTIASLFNRAYEQGQSSVSFKCANLEIYDQVRGALIGQSEVFDFIRGDGATISYVEDEEQRTLCFWL